MTEDPEFGDKYGENITYVTISPDGSIVATFNPYDPSILITRVVTNEAATSETVISEAVTSDTITTEAVTNEAATSEAATITDIKQFQLSRASGGGMIKLFKFSFDNSNDINVENIPPINHRGGVVTFLRYTKNSLKKSATLICMDYMRIQKIKIKLKSIQKRTQFGCRKNISVSKDGTYLLPENLFEKLESIKDAKRNWKFLLKSRYQEFLMIDTSNHQKINIEIYDVNNLQLVNVFYRHRGEHCLNSNDNEPGIFALSIDSRLFAYSYGNNIITLYLMESGLKIVSKRFDKIYKIKFLEFIEKDKKLFIIGEDKEHNVKFHIWIISGCLKMIFLFLEMILNYQTHSVRKCRKLHKPQSIYSSYPYYDGLELHNDLELQNNYLKSANDLTLALKFCQDRDAVMLAYLLEYYSENSMSHIGWMLNVTKILPDLSKLSNHDYYGNYMDSLLFKPCFGEMKYIFFAYPSLLTKEDLTSTEASQDKPLDTIWDAVLSMYYLNTNNLDDYSNYWPFKLLVFTANIVIVLVLLNMIIALMNDTFNKAKEDSNLGLMMYRTELIDDFERLEIPFINFKLYNSPYICYLQDPNLMKKWMIKSQKLRESKLYSWFDESVDNDSVSKENKTYYDKVNFTSWYELISGSKNQVPFTTPEDHETIWF
ncbi:hypothetical protein RhiirA4_426844 [Rhizophagus irregularis]|uniref:Ion transport domain-containing protein n=1 Tax=Rhizophagus irregularis TaxID=588596 RepID=A0A2I1H6S5_9GLOM|nr:hypothetical protein RhiirA4_426844 [Rhizophagus irregularis]